LNIINRTASHQHVISYIDVTGGLSIHLSSTEELRWFLCWICQL